MFPQTESVEEQYLCECSIGAALFCSQKLKILDFLIHVNQVYTTKECLHTLSGFEYTHDRKMTNQQVRNHESLTADSSHAHESERETERTEVDVILMRSPFSSMATYMNCVSVT